MERETLSTKEQKFTIKYIENFTYGAFLHPMNPPRESVQL